MYKNGIVIGLLKEDLDSILEVLPFKKFNINMEDNDICYVVIKDVEWMPEYEIQHLKLVNELHELGDSFCFIKLGDDLLDTEIHGNAQKFNMAVQRKIIYGDTSCS